MRPVIGVVGRNFKDNECNIIGVGERIRHAVIRSGGIPFLILPPQIVMYEEIIPEENMDLSEEEKSIIIKQLEFCDGIVFPGGSKRFSYDLFILNYAIEHDIPVLGICLGMQILTMIDSEGNPILNMDNIDNHSLLDGGLHEISISKDSLLYSIFENDKVMVNSRHKRCVLNSGTFQVYGMSSDGVIELIERHDKKFMVGVQWHPEMMEDSIKQKMIFDLFISSCKESCYENQI